MTHRMAYDKCFYRFEVRKRSIDDLEKVFPHQF